MGNCNSRVVITDNVNRCIMKVACLVSTSLNVFSCSQNSKLIMATGDLYYNSVNDFSHCVTSWVGHPFSDWLGSVLRRRDVCIVGV